MVEPIRILYLEDEPDFCEFVKGRLETDGLSARIVRVGDLENFIAVLEQGGFDIILADYLLPTCTGIQALNEARQRCPEMPFVLFSGMVGEQAAIQALKSGATDYVLKQWPERLASAVRRAVQEARERAERKQVETELRRQEKYFRALTENSLDVLAVLNRNGELQYESPALKHILGYDPADLAGQQALALLHPDDLPVARKAFEQALQSPGRSVRTEFRFRRQDGYWCHLEVVGQNCLDEPYIAGLVLNARDVTERKQASAALRESEARHRSLFENISEGVAYCRMLVQPDGSRDFIYLAVNRAFENLTGLKKVAGRKVSEVIPGLNQAHPELFETYRRVAMTGQPEHFEIFLTPLQAWLSISVYSTEREFFVTVFDNITERKRAEALLRLQGAALESAANAIVITDRVGTVTWANAAFSRLTGYALEEIVGQNPRVLKSGKHEEGFYRSLWDTILAGNVWRTEMVNRRKDGSLYTEENTITPVRDERGEVTHFIAIKQDITARQQLEEKLRQSQKMEGVGQLAGGVAHDFNNLLAVIRGNAELLLMNAGQMKTADKGCLDEVISAVDRAANLTRQLLLFSRKQLMQSQPLSLNELIANLVRMLNRIIREDIRLNCVYGQPLPFAQADPGMMEQVIVNLVVNARDAMPNGGQLVISTREVRLDAAEAKSIPEARAGEFVCLEVEDSGTGIAPEHLPHIYEPFFTTKEPGKGTGLGLATVYGVVKQHQGWIEVHSRVAQGTRFRVFLPAITPPPATAASLQTKAESRGGTESILVVEDDKAVRMVTRRVLEAYGYKVYEAASGRQALEIWRDQQEQVALLLTDVIMPEGVTGLELAQELRVRRPGLKIVFMTGYSAEALGKDTDTVRLTNHFVLHKPCSPGVLLHTVRRCLDEGS